MSTKKAALVAVGLAAAAFLFAWVMWNFSDSRSSMDIANPSATQTKPVEKSQPVTADSATDDLIDEIMADREDLDAEVAGEISDLEADNALLNDLSNVYDENE